MCSLANFSSDYPILPTVFLTSGTRKHSSRKLANSDNWNYDPCVKDGAFERQTSERHDQQLALAKALNAIGDHWTLLIVLALVHDPQRPVELRRQLPGISASVLDRHLQQMVALGLLLRRRFKEMPPRVEVTLTDSGRELLPLARALARWGAQHM